MSFLDHRQIAGEMELYFFDEKIGAGLPVWLPRGAHIRGELEGFLKSLERARGYQHVVSPPLARSELYRISGHLDCFGSNMFPPIRGGDEAELRLRPMNCPHHHLIFGSVPRSYRELPLRFAELGQVYRKENSGSLLGLSRVRSLCQNDAHIYVAPEAAAAELAGVLKLFEHCYRVFGLEGYRYRLSLGDRAQPASFPGDPEMWDRCEAELRNALKCAGLPFFEAVGEAAFYGPKIDVQMRIGNRDESIASVQLDFLSAARFGLEYVGAGGERRRPWVIHRAPVGSLERFIALLLERCEGRLPAWLAPVQVAVLPVRDEHAEASAALVGEMLAGGARAELFAGAGSVSKRIRAAHRARPFAILVVGDREAAGGKHRLQLREESVDFERCNLGDVLKSVLGASWRR